MQPMTFLITILTALLLQQGAPPAKAPDSSTLDYDTFKTKIQPIFMAKREGHARCYSCHSTGTPLRLQRLLPGQTAWNEQQSRANFEAVSKFVLPGVPMKSRLLLHPLHHEAGGDHF